MLSIACVVLIFVVLGLFWALMRVHAGAENDRVRAVNIEREVFRLRRELSQAAALPFASALDELGRLEYRKPGRPPGLIERPRPDTGKILELQDQLSHREKQLRILCDLLKGWDPNAEDAARLLKGIDLSVPPAVEGAAARQARLNRQPGSS